MSRLAGIPISIPKGVSINVNPNHIVEVKGPKKTVHLQINDNIKLICENDLLKIDVDFDALSEGKKTRVLRMKRRLNVLSGTIRAALQNAITGVADGFSIKLELVGVGYRAQLQSNTINLSLGKSHPESYQLPEGVRAEVPSQTEIILHSHDNELLGKVASEIRSKREPEYYKGKGIRCTGKTKGKKHIPGEVINLKETKKK